MCKIFGNIKKSRTEVKLAKEREIFDKQIDVHDLPEIFHYWPNKYLRPLLEEDGVSNPDLFLLNICLRVQSTAKSQILCSSVLGLVVAIPK